MIPKGGLTMPQIYQEEVGNGDSVSQAKLSHKDGNINMLRSHVLPNPQYVGYTRKSENQVNHLFKRLSNPEIPIYIYPHMAQLNGESYPKPGMSTAFFLYKHDHFALPNEVY